MRQYWEVTTFFRVFPNFIFPNLGKLGNFPIFFPVFGGPILEPPKLLNRVDFPLLGKLGKLGKTSWATKFKSFSQFSQFSQFGKKSKFSKYSNQIYLVHPSSYLLRSCLLARTSAPPWSSRDGRHRLRYVPSGKSGTGCKQVQSRINANRLRARCARRHGHSLCVSASVNLKVQYKRTHVNLP
jgi:hypothetical protein